MSEKHSNYINDLQRDLAVRVDSSGKSFLDASYFFYEFLKAAHAYVAVSVVETSLVQTEISSHLTVEEVLDTTGQIRVDRNRSDLDIFLTTD